MARIVGAIATSHTPTIGFALRPEVAGRPGLGPDLRGLRADPEVARREEARRARPHLQRPRHLVLLRPLLRVRPGNWRVLPGRRRRRRSARAPRRARPRGPRAAHRLQPGGRRVRHVLLSGQAARPRRAVAALDGAAARPGLARADRAPAGRRAAVSRAVGAALLQAGSGAPPRDRELSGTSLGRDRCHRRPFAPGARRARGLQQHALGHAVPRARREGPGAAHRADPGGVRAPRRHGGRRGDHVARDARGDVGHRPQDPPDLLPALDDRHRDGDLRERRDRHGGRHDCGAPRAHRARSSPARRSSRAPIPSRSRAASRATASTSSCTR